MIRTFIGALVALLWSVTAFAADQVANASQATLGTWKGTGGRLTIQITAVADSGLISGSLTDNRSGTVMFGSSGGMGNAKGVLTGNTMRIETPMNATIIVTLQTDGRQFTGTYSGSGNTQNIVLDKN